MAESGNNRAWLKPFIKPLVPTFRETIVMSAFINLVALATPVFTMQVYDRVVFHKGISTLWGLVIGMIAVIIFDLVLKLARSRVMQTVALRVDVLVGRQLFDKLMALPLAELESKPAGYWQGPTATSIRSATRSRAGRRCWSATCPSCCCSLS
jgi:ATP-binding cassette subfamily C protein LapB